MWIYVYMADITIEADIEVVNMWSSFYSWVMKVVFRSVLRPYK